MKINSILLYNFGSYEGETLFDTRPTADGKNIVLIGGKNGAGKTTLFTAMRVCLCADPSAVFQQHAALFLQIRSTPFG